MKTKILIIDPPKARDIDFRRLPTIHLCPDAEDLYWGMHERRPPLYWNRIHVNTRWFHLASAITPSGRFIRMRRTEPGPDGNRGWERDFLYWASIGRWKGTSKHYRGKHAPHDKRTCEMCQMIRKARREGRTSGRLARKRSGSSKQYLPAPKDRP